MKKITAVTLFFLTIGVLLTWSLAAGTISLTEFVTPPLTLLLKVFVTLVGLRAIVSHKLALFSTLLVLFVALGILTADAFFSSEPMIYQFLQFFNQVTLYISGLVPHHPAYELLISWAIVFGFSLFVLIFGYLKFNFFLLFSASCGLFAVIITSGFFHFYPAFYVFVITMLAYLANYLSARHGGKLSAPFAYYAVPVTLATVLIAAFIPTPEEEVFTEDFAYTFLSSPLRNLNLTLYDMFRPKHFSLAQTGFGTGNERRLGGNVIPNYQLVMRIHSPEEVIYLTGAVLDTYTGYAWVDSFADELEYLDFNRFNLPLLEMQTTLLNQFILGGYRAFDGLEMYRGWSYDFSHRFFNWLDYDPETSEYTSAGWHGLDIDFLLNRILIQQQLTVDTLDLSTFSVFYTGVLSDYTPPTDTTRFQQTTNGTLTSNVLIPRNTFYFLDAHQPYRNLNVPYLLHQSYAGKLATVRVAFNEDDLNVSFAQQGETLSFGQLLDDYLIPRAAWIRDVYTQLPEDFPLRVVELAEEITANATSDFERAVMLETFLRQFTYTLSPGHLPVGRDFVDHFLFDLRMGYCTYYASAFVTMARALGLPTRYIEGFIALSTPGEWTEIRNRQGHAWAEVYFEGFGWHRFDPTPPGDTFGAIFAGSGSAHDPTAGFSDFWDVFSDFDFDGRSWWDHEYMMEDMEGAFLNFTGGETGAPSDPTGGDGAIGGFNFQDFMGQLMTLSVGLVLLVIGGRTFFIHRQFKPKKGRSHEEMVIRYFKGITRYLKYFEYDRGSHETSMEFGKRIGKRFGFANEQMFMADIAAIYQKAKFSPHGVTAEDVEIMRRAYITMDYKMRENTHRYRYFVHKYILAEV